MEQQQRVKVGSDRGTVRYIGEVQGAKGTWYGIEWDDPSRGRHNGSRNGIQYFEAKHPTGASFVKAKKVNCGVSFLQALETRYGEEEAASSVEVNARQRIDLELVGEDRVKSRIQQHDELREAQLRDTDINDTIEDTLASRCPNIAVLDVSFNLISKWSTVEAMCTQLPHVTSLNVSGNRMVLDGLYKDTTAFHGITCLYISHMPGLTWDQVVSICRPMPNLQELHACENDMSHVSMNEDTRAVFSKLHILNLYGNKLNNWAEVLALGQLPELRDLKLNCNKLGDASEFSALGTLTSISLASNAIVTWDTVAALGKLKNLTHVRIRHNPFAANVTEAVARKLCIHHLPHVVMLNGSEVTQREREIAERFYTDFTKPKQEHANTLAAQLVMLQVTVERSEQPSTSFELRVPPRITIGKLKRLLQAQHFAGVRAPDQRLTLVDNACGDIALEDDLRELSHYSVTGKSALTVRS